MSKEYLFSDIREKIENLLNPIENDSEKVNECVSDIISLFRDYIVEHLEEEN